MLGIYRAGSREGMGGTVMRKVHEAAQWIWNCRGKNVWLTPFVLTKDNPDESAPELTIGEATSLFKLLEEEKLIFPYKTTPDGSTQYLVNEAKEKDWHEFLKGLSWWQKWFVRPLVKIFGTVWLIIVWLMSIMIAAALGSGISELVKAAFKKWFT
jgi:hypothetical protein